MGSPLDLLGWVLAFWYSLFPSYGFAIIGLTVVVRILVFPLVAKSVRSQKAMSEFAPQIKQIQAKYRDDRQKQNEELMAFYKENRINPLSGCLPLLLQMPVFFGLMRVLRHPERYVPVGSSLFKDMCPGGEEVCRADGIAHIKFLGMDLQTSAADAAGAFREVLPHWLLLGLVVLTGLYQGRQMMARQTNPNPQVAIIARVMPIGFGVLSIGFASGVILYFLTSNLWQIGQQAFIYRHDKPAVPVGGVVDVEADERPRKQSRPDAGGAGNGERAGSSEGGMRAMFARRLPPGRDAGSTENTGVELAKEEPEGSSNGGPSTSTPARSGANRGGGSASRAKAKSAEPSGAGAEESPPDGGTTGTSGTPRKSQGGQRPSGRAAGTSNRSKNKRKRR